VPLAFFAAYLTPRRLKGLAVSFGSDFLSKDVDRAVAALAVAVVLLSLGGTPDLVDPGRVARSAVFRQISLKKTVLCWFFLVWFSL
jgi:hypothetical protein